METQFGQNISLSKTHNDLLLMGRIRVDKGGKAFLSLSKIFFLEYIREYGSITKAAAAMGFSYRKAWGLVEEMNAVASAPLVSTQTGGKGGGGAKITREGERVIALYWEFCAGMSDFLNKHEEILKRF